MSSSLGFKEYDQQFRMKLSNNPAGTWGVVDPELWLLYVTPSVNHFIDPYDCTVAYTSLDQVLQEVARLDRGTVLAKTYTKSAFILMIINPGIFTY